VEVQLSVAGGGAAGDVFGDKRCVPPDPADEVRAAMVLEALPEHVEPRNRSLAATRADVAVPVEHRHPKPRVVAAVSSGPDHGADAGGTQIEFP